MGDIWEELTQDSVPPPIEGEDCLHYAAVQGGSADIHALARRFVDLIRGTEAGNAFLEDYPPQAMNPNDVIRCDSLDSLVGWLTYENSDLAAEVDGVIEALRSQLADYRHIPVIDRAAFRIKLNRHMNAARYFDQCRLALENAMCVGIVPDVVTFNTWLKYCHSSDQCIQLFEKMIECGINPNDVTLTALSGKPFMQKHKSKLLEYLKGVITSHPEFNPICELVAAPKCSQSPTTLRASNSTNPQ